jgi:hypothetical protein
MRYLRRKLSFTFRSVNTSSVNMEIEKAYNAVITSSKWQAPVIKGRFSKSVWIGNPSEATPALPTPVLVRPRCKK